MNENLFILAKYKDDFQKHRPKSLAKTLYHKIHKIWWSLKDYQLNKKIFRE